jgi:hypothetical protein
MRILGLGAQCDIPDFLEFLFFNFFGGLSWHAATF